ncbi:hypothetical protein MPUL_04450 [Mycolicibacterium pulveris]|uniref:Uncharacterized protein n=1 Tax=Mycolicibacterium pulveris TaxID=36813 RepID=A0A7I7UDF9_MYCPV|nr:hypothetical protein MPUL_04450 [Mycolicibacterium pulveris]
MYADSSTGMTNSTGVQLGPAITIASRPSVRNPTAKWAIGEIRMTTGFDAAGELTRPSSHHRESDRQCEEAGCTRI